MPSSSLYFNILPMPWHFDLQRSKRIPPDIFKYFHWNKFPPWWAQLSDPNLLCIPDWRLFPNPWPDIPTVEGIHSFVSFDFVPFHFGYAFHEKWFIKIPQRSSWEMSSFRRASMTLIMEMPFSRLCPSAGDSHKYATVWHLALKYLRSLRHAC